MPGVDNRRPTRAWALGTSTIQRLLQFRKRAPSNIIYLPVCAITREAA